MRSSESARSAIWAAVALLLTGAVLSIGALRSELSARFREVKTNVDVYALPSPEQTVVLSLGHRSAFADLLYANLLVSYGVHFQERRRFEFVGNYLRTINELDPTFASPYRYADTMLTLQPVEPRWQDFVEARGILERGLKERPTDGELHNSAGQFLAYLAPARAPTEALKSEYRLRGARVLARACELLGSDPNMPFKCVTAATVFNRAGEREATISFLRRFLAISDDEEVRRLALAQLRAVVGEEEQARLTRRTDTLNRLWASDLPFVLKDTWLVVGPPTDVWRCAGRGAPEDCTSSWVAWGERQR